MYPLLQLQLINIELPSGECVYAGQTLQSASDFAAIVVEYLPAPQLVHDPLPLPVLYVPAVHAAQPPAPSLVKPALQIQSEAAVLPGSASEFAVHAEQVLSAVAALADEYLPAPQSVHTTAASTAENLPTPQSSQPSSP